MTVGGDHGPGNLRDRSGYKARTSRAGGSSVTFVALEVARLHHGILMLQFVTNLNIGAILCCVSMHPCSMLTQTAIDVLNSMLLAYALAKYIGKYTGKTLVISRTCSTVTAATLQLTALMLLHC